MYNPAMKVTCLRHPDIMKMWIHWHTSISRNCSTSVIFGWKKAFLRNSCSLWVCGQLQ